MANDEMDYEQYREAYFLDPVPDSRFEFSGGVGITLFFDDHAGAVRYYEAVLGPPAYSEGDGTTGWPVGLGWLTLLRGRSGSPTNVEVQFRVSSPAEAERLQAAFINAGGTGPSPSDQLMYEPIRSCPVRDPFGTDLLVFSPLNRPGS